MTIRSFIPWVGGKGRLLWLIRKLSPRKCGRFVDVFGGSGTVTLDRPLMPHCTEIYNDFNSNLTNLFCCVKNRTMALIRELGFLPLNSRDDFNVIYKFLSGEEFTDDYLKEEMELTEVWLEPPDGEMIRRLMLERSPRGDVSRAAAFFKMIRYSYNSTGKSFGARSCDLRRFFHLIWECSRRLANVVIENKDCVELINQYNRPDTFFYCDPPYYDAEEHYEVEFPKEDHQRLHDALAKCKGFVMVSYNYCQNIVDLYQDFYIFYTTRPNSMSHKPDDKYEEVVITNYDPRDPDITMSWQLTLFGNLFPDEEGGKYSLIHEPPPKPDTENEKEENNELCEEKPI